MINLIFNKIREYKKPGYDEPFKQFIFFSQNLRIKCNFKIILNKNIFWLKKK